MHCADCYSENMRMRGSISSPSWQCADCGSTKPPVHAHDKLPEQQQEEEGVLPDRVWIDNRGVYMADCQVCEDSYELPCDLDEFNPDMSYCGKDPRCCP